MIIYLPVHKTVRELDGKLFFALKAAAKGFTVVIGRKSRVLNLLGQGPKGIFFDTRMNHSRVTVSSKNHQAILKMGHEIWLFDEEVTSLDDAQAYAKTQISKEVVEKASKVLAWSDFHASLVKQISPSTEVFVTGHPRYDVYDPRVRGIYDRDATRHRKSFDKYVLISSSFGELAFGGQDAVDQKLKVNRSKGFLKDEADVRFYREEAAYRSQTLEAFMVDIVELARSHSKVNFVVRPHFTETEEMWGPILESQLPNLHVVHDGPIASWIHGSIGLIHHHCSTALEAYFLGKQVVSYVPVEDSRFERFLPGAVSLTVRNFDDLSQSVVALQNEESLVDHVAVAQKISEYINHGGKLASDQILELLEARETKKPHSSSEKSQETGLPKLGGGRLVRQLSRLFDWLAKDEISQRLVRRKRREMVRQDSSLRGVVARRVGREVFVVSSR